jgi:hypothetical protein
MGAGEIAYVIASWALGAAGLFWFTNRHRHENRQPWAAFFLFAGVFGGIAFTAIALIVGTIFATGLEHSPANALGAPLAIVVIIPAWRYARSLIAKPG